MGTPSMDHEVRVDDPHLLARAHVEREDEMPAAIAHAERYGLTLEYDPIRLTARMSIEGPGAGPDMAREKYLLTASFADYRELPPIWRFVHPGSGDDVGPAAYPAPHPGSVLHGNGVICAHWNRLAYSEHNGPHSDWGGPANWQTTMAGQTMALTIPDMLDRVIRDVVVSAGRMAPLPS